MDAFISHSSKDDAAARRIEKALQLDGLTVWLDRSRIRLGALLRDELQQAIRDSRVLVSLWSQHAAASRWVAAEIITAFHLGRFILPCSLDEAPLPFFLRNTVYLKLDQPSRQKYAELRRAVRDAPHGPNELAPALSSRSPELQQAIQNIYQGQELILEKLGQRQIDAADQLQQAIEPVMLGAEKLWPLDSMVLNLGGFHRKNAYLIRFWDEIQAGRPPKDPLLRQSERYFIETLFVQPNDYSALDGIASLLLLSGELDAAEFFDQRAVDLAAQDGIDYEAAKENLKLIRYHKAKAAPQGPGRQTATHRPRSDRRPQTAGGKMPSARDLVERGNAAFYRGDYAGALSAYDLALALKPDDADTQRLHGVTLLYLYRGEEGLASIDRSLALRLDDPPSLVARGAALVGLGRFAEGLQALDRALEIDPDLPDAMYNKACAYSLLLDGKQSLTWLKKAVQAFPGYRQLAQTDPHLEFLRQTAEYDQEMRVQ